MKKNLNFISTFNCYKIAFAVLCITLFQACSIAKYIPEGELLYTGATLKIKTDSIVKNESELKTELESTIRPVPNSKILGIYPGLYYYYKMQQEKPSFISRWMYKKIGKKPVYQSSIKTFEVENILVNRLENHGFFYSRASSKINKNEENKKASVNYLVEIKQSYKMKTYQVDSLPEPIFSEIKKSVANTEMKPGIRFDLEFLKTERLRIDADLKNAGYYNFNSDFLIFEADTTRYKNKTFNLFLKLKNAVPEDAIKPYKIGNINIHTDYDIKKDSIKQKSTRYNEKNYIQNETFFKTKHLDPFVTLNEGDLYNPEASRNTARRLSTIGTYKFVNIQYQERDSTLTDSSRILDTNIYLSPLNKRSIRTELQAVTKSNDFAGPALEFSYTNRNIFRGGEILTLSTNLGYELQIGSGNTISNTSVGVKSEITVPRVIFPIKINEDFFEYSIPKTKISLSVDYLNRTELYTLLSGTAEFGYTWNANKYTTHQLNPISINYNNLINTSTEFDDILNENSYLEQSFEQQFIAGLNYSYIYNEMINSSKKNQWYTNVTFDITGNGLSLFDSKDNDDTQTFLGLEYAQYVKADIDLRYHFNFKNEQKIATRLFAGYGIPYGNSEYMPYIKQYYSGGPNSIRAFKIRSLGPGTYISEDNTTDDYYLDQTGNIRLEANIEYRFPLFSYFKGAVFADAGNIWNATENEDVPGGEFSSDFINQLGIGVGVGLRLDVQGFVLRFDFAAPVHDPALPEGERYNFQYKETIFNFGVGYPF